MHIYTIIPTQGNVEEFVKHTGWIGSGVLYMGDHVYSDLAVSICMLLLSHAHARTQTHTLHAQHTTRTTHTTHTHKRLGFNAEFLVLVISGVC